MISPVGNCPFVLVIHPLHNAVRYKRRIFGDKKRKNKQKIANELIWTGEKNGIFPDKWALSVGAVFEEKLMSFQTSIFICRTEQTKIDGINKFEDEMERDRSVLFIRFCNLKNALCDLLWSLYM